MQLKQFYFIPLVLLVGLFTSSSSINIPPTSNEKFVVVLDAGHGGHDPGNLGNGYFEKNIALNIVLQVGAVLKNHQDIEVVYTRKDDTFVDLYVRGEIANKANADLFVSVHCDSHTSDANGAGTFVLGLHANKQNFEIAKKENSVIYLEDNYESRYAEYNIDSPESVIGLTIMQEEFLDQSIMLAKMMQDNFSDGLKRNNRKVKQAGFIVLHQTFMPSVLIETGFLTNKSEGMYLNSKKGQSEMGNAIAEAIVKYKNSISVSSSVTAVSEPVKAANTKKEPIPVQETPEKEIVELKKETVPVIVPKEEKSVPKDLPGKEDVAVNKELNVPQEVINKPEEIAEKPKEVVKKDLPTEEATKVAEKVAEEIKEKPAVKEPVIKKPVVVASTEEKKEVVPEKKKEVIPEKKTAIPSKKASSVLFKVQILASSKNLPLVPTNFNGLNKLSKEPYKNLFRYMYGNTNSYKDAKLLKSNADLKGFTTSYIVAYKDGKRISVQEALKYTSD